MQEKLEKHRSLLPPFLLTIFFVNVESILRMLLFRSTVLIVFVSILIFFIILLLYSDYALYFFIFWLTSIFESTSDFDFICGKMNWKNLPVPALK